MHEASIGVWFVLPEEKKKKQTKTFPYAFGNFFFNMYREIYWPNTKLSVTLIDLRASNTSKLMFWARCQLLKFWDLEKVGALL